MKSRPFYFEIKDMLTQFVAAFDDIVIGRFNKSRDEQDQIAVRYIYAPKQRVLYDLVNENKTLTLPAVAVNVTSVSRDENRVFNKLDGFYYQGSIGQDKVTRHLKAPVPININLSVSILSRYQTDMDQILSNFVPFCNPYVVISWKIPEEFGLSIDQEIRSEVMWNGDISLNYPTDLPGNQKARVTADTSFTIKGWLFKDTDNPSGNIFYIDSNFNLEDKLITYDNYDSLSANSYTYPTSSGMDTPRTETVRVSGLPFVTGISLDGVRLREDFIDVNLFKNSNIIIEGTGMNFTENVLLSTNDSTYYTNLTTITGFTRQPDISGQVISFSAINDNSITFDVGLSSSATDRDIRFIPYSKAGYTFTDTSILNVLSGKGTPTTFIKVDFSVMGLEGYPLTADYGFPANNDIIGTQGADTISIP